MCHSSWGKGGDGGSVGSGSQELLVQTGHYSERTRVAGLAGLGDLLGKHPEQVPRNAAQLLEGLAPRVSDADGGVRKALLALLAAQARAPGPRAHARWSG